jgi:hypothetical protein
MSSLFTPPKRPKSSSSTTNGESSAADASASAAGNAGSMAGATTSLSEKSRVAAAKASEAWQRSVVGGFGGLMSSSGLASGLSTGLGTGLAFGSVLNRAVEKDNNNDTTALPGNKPTQSPATTVVSDKNTNEECSEAGANDKSDAPANAEGIAKENLLHLSMKLSARLKAVEGNYEKLKMAYQSKRTQSNALHEIVAVLGSQNERLAGLSTQLMAQSTAGSVAPSSGKTTSTAAEGDASSSNVSCRCSRMCVTMCQIGYSTTRSKMMVSPTSPMLGLHDMYVWRCISESEAAARERRGHVGSVRDRAPCFISDSIPSQRRSCR